MSKRILVTGAGGYIGRRLVRELVEEGYYVICTVRDKKRFDLPTRKSEQLEVLEIDFLDENLPPVPSNLDGAYYLIHSMSHSKNYQQLEQKTAIHFRNWISKKVNHVIYLSGMVNEDKLSPHLASRKKVEDELKKGEYNFTTLRAGIIIGSGSASFEIIRDLVEKLPVMITPKWVLTKCQPIGIRDVLKFLTKTILNPKTFNQSFDIGGKDVLTYKEMMLQYAKVRSLRRIILTIPLMTPRLSSYWLYFVTAVSYKLATALVDSMKVEVVCSNHRLQEILNIETHNYMQSLEMAFDKIEQDEIPSSWKDSFSSSSFKIPISEFVQVPQHGCLKDKRVMKVNDTQASLQKIWSIGGETGWYYGNTLWKIRGYLDKLAGGIGLRRGRTHQSKIQTGDSIDFWRVLYADKEEGRLLLFAEMKLPGDAWLEFNLNQNTLTQTATFRPRGVWGRIYWFMLVPFHHLIFQGMLKKIARSPIDQLVKSSSSFFDKKDRTLANQ